MSSSATRCHPPLQSSSTCPLPRDPARALTWRAWTFDPHTQHSSATLLTKLKQQTSKNSLPPATVLSQTCGFPRYAVLLPKTLPHQRDRITIPIVSKVSVMPSSRHSTISAMPSLLLERFVAHVESILTSVPQLLLNRPVRVDLASGNQDGGRDGDREGRGDRYAPLRSDTIDNWRTARDDGPPGGGGG